MLIITATGNERLNWFKRPRLLFAPANFAALSEMNDLTMREFIKMIPRLFSQRFCLGELRVRLGDKTSQRAITRKTARKDASLIDDS